MLRSAVLSAVIVKLFNSKWRRNLSFESCKSVPEFLLSARTVADQVERKFALDLRRSCNCNSGFVLRQFGTTLAQVKLNQKRLPSEVSKRRWIQCVRASDRWSLAKIKADVYMSFSRSLPVSLLIYGLRDHESFWKEADECWVTLFDFRFWPQSCLRLTWDRHSWIDKVARTPSKTIKKWENTVFLIRTQVKIGRYAESTQKLETSCNLYNFRDKVRVPTGAWFHKVKKDGFLQQNYTRIRPGPNEIQAVLKPFLDNMGE